MMSDAIAAVARIVCGCHARWADAPPAPGAHVYYANHTSHLDSLIIWAALPKLSREQCRIVAAADYWNATGVRRWLAQSVFRALLIERQKITRGNNPLDAMLDAIDDDEAIVIFPEGSRGDGNNMQTFRTGLWHLARKRPALRFTPVWLENLNRILPKGEYLPVPMMTAVTFGTAFGLESEQSKAEFLESVRSRLEQLRQLQ